MSRTAPPRPRSLRRRLVAGAVALMTVTSLLVGAVTALLLHRSLVERLDQAVLEAARGPLSAPRGQADPAADPPPLPVDTLVLVTAPEGPSGETVLRAEHVDRSGTSRPLEEEQRRELLAALGGGDGPVTVRLEGSGAFRLARAHAPDGRSVIAGRSLAEAEATIANLVLITAAVALGAVLLGAFAAARMAGAATRPLERVAATARRVAEQPLARGEVRLAERVPAADTDPRTEVGQVGASLNRLLGHVEESLNARQRSEEQLRRFIADAGHELRTPLASVRGYTELAQRRTERLNEEQRRSLDRIGSESLRMSALVEDLLLLARLDAGQQPRMERLDLGPLVVDAVSDAMAAGRSHRWELDVESEEAIVHGDPHRLHQVVANLLANARTHTPPGTTVTASVRREEERVVLRVHDDGPGIPAELLPDVFDRFVRGEASRVRRGASSGLGLSISQAIVASHGGSIEASSVAGDTCFTVRLPAGEQG